MGDYMFNQYRGKWIPDSPARRKAIVSGLRTWRAFSNSSPVEGITAAIRTYYDPSKKISLFVFGDEYSGHDPESVIREVDRINRTGPGGELLVRLHAVGFPVLVIPGGSVTPENALPPSCECCVRRTAARLSD
ncbi:MAG: hypothetical protein U9N82_02770 [Thermodesulfobacteriota bacterium]|nr:hypothetical protein [Thermodesulfobacteriota bacterium]